MRKILATLLALMMVIATIPLTIIPAAAATLTAPTAFPDTTDEWVLTSITDGTLTLTGKGAKFATDFDNTTKTVFDDGNSVNKNHVTGMVFKVDTSSSANLQWYFSAIKYSDGTADQKLTAASQKGYWYDANGWTAITTGNTSWTANAKSGYVYYDFSDLNFTGTEIADIKIYYPSATRHGTISEWHFVQTTEQAALYPLVPESEPEVPEAEPITAPATFPGTETPILYKSVTDGKFIKEDGVASNTYSKDLTYTYNIFDGNKTQNLANYSGIIVKAKATGTSKLYLRFKLMMSDGTELEIKSNNRPIAWYDGTSWSELAGADSNWQTPIGEGYAFLAFPLDEFAASASEVADIKVYSSNGTGRIGEFSELSLVYSADKIITSASVSLTDDLAWNVKANAPDGCTDGTMTFSFNGKDTQPTLTNGRYSLTGILPQQIGMDITATWTGTVNGVTFTDSVTSSVESYCKTILKTEGQADWHELAKALLHYGAAAQTATGYEGVLSNDGVDAVTNPVDLSAIAPVATNNDTAVWKGATLRLDGALALKIRLEAPADVTTVTATVDGRSESTTLNIVDGYVILSLNAYELSRTITFSYGDADKTLVITADYVLKNTTNAAYKALVQAVANYGSEAAQKKA